TLTWIGTIAGFGFPVSITRFYTEYKKEGETHLRFFYSNMLFSVILTGIFAVLGIFVVSLFFMKENYLITFWYYMRISSVLVLLRVVLAVLKEMYRVEKRYYIYNIVSISSRYGSLICSIIFFFLCKDVYGLFLGVLIIEGAVTTICLIHKVLEKKVGL